MVGSRQLGEGVAVDLSPVRRVPREALSNLAWLVGQCCGDRHYRRVIIASLAKCGRPHEAPSPLLAIEPEKRILDELRRGADHDEGSAWTPGVDAAVVRAHQHAAGARRLLPADVDPVLATTEVDTGGPTE
jgi:hypothetical protein